MLTCTVLAIFPCLMRVMRVPFKKTCIELIMTDQLLFCSLTAHDNIFYTHE